LGLDARLVGLLCVDWVSPHGPWDDTLMFVFDGGVLSSDQIAGLRLIDGELSGYKFCTEEEASTVREIGSRRSVEVEFVLEA
jgi:8-oxo-dGTP diphosphatase